MLSSRHALSSLLAASALLFTCGASSELLPESDPGRAAVETPGVLVEVDPGSHLLVCVNGVRIVLRTGQAPPCPTHSDPPGPPDVAPVPPPLPEEPDPEQPIPKPPLSGSPNPPGAPPPEPKAPAQAPLVEEAPPVPTTSAQEFAAAPEEPPASPVPTPAAESAPEQVAAGLSRSSPGQDSGAFTPMRTTVVLMVVIAVVAAGAGRAAVRSSDRPARG